MLPPLSTYLMASCQPFAILYTLDDREEEQPSTKAALSLADCASKTNLSTRKIKPTLAYEWHVEKAELTIASKRLGLFIESYPGLLDKVQCLCLQSSSKQPEDTLSRHLECFKNLSHLKLIGPFQHLAALQPIAKKLEQLSCIDTHLAPENIRALEQFEKFQSLVLLGYAFKKPRQDFQVIFPKLASLKHMRLEALNAWFLKNLSNKLPNLEALYLETHAVTDEDLQALASLEALRVLNMSLKRPLRVESIAPLQNRNVQTLSLCFRGFATKDSGKHFLSYFPNTEVLQLEGNGANVCFYVPSMENLKALKALQLENIQLCGLRSETFILQLQGIHIEHMPSSRGLQLQSRL